MRRENYALNGQPPAEHTPAEQLVAAVGQVSQLDVGSVLATANAENALTGLLVPHSGHTGRGADELLTSTSKRALHFRQSYS
jgi:hypothetical protein